MVGRQLIILILLVFHGFSCTNSYIDNSEECLTIDFNNTVFAEGPVDPGMIINDCYIQGDCLLISLSYAGGCTEHNIGMAAMGWVKTNPAQVDGKIIHQNDDSCEAWITEELVFDLLPLRYENDSLLIINLEGFDKQIIHTYSE
jgi:hypothetical protein